MIIRGQFDPFVFGYNEVMDKEGDQPLNRTSVSENRVSCFETTQWSTVVMAAGRSSVEANQALAELCQAYWMPLYTYVRCHLNDAHQAQDLTQTFFEKLMEKNYLRAADPAKGRFRAFLLVAMKRLMSNEWEKQSALKRGGGQAPLSLDFAAANLRFGRLNRETLTAEQVFLQNWVRTLLDRVFDQLKREFDAAGKGDQFSHFKVFITVGDDATRVSQVAEKMGISSGAARVAVHRLRRRYRQVLHDQVAETVDNPADVEDEIRSLFAAFE